MKLAVVVFIFLMGVLHWLDLAFRVSVLFVQTPHLPLAFAACLMTLVDVVVSVLLAVADVMMMMMMMMVFPLPEDILDAFTAPWPLVRAERGGRHLRRRLSQRCMSELTGMIGHLTLASGTVW